MASAIPQKKKAPVFKEQAKPGQGQGQRLKAGAVPSWV